MRHPRNLRFLVGYKLVTRRGVIIIRRYGQRALYYRPSAIGEKTISPISLLLSSPFLFSIFLRASGDEKEEGKRRRRRRDLHSEKRSGAARVVKRKRKSVK